ncbi:NADH dehydrogenase [ubiquinone] 1 alpha subcomplex subunit 3 [Ammospiza caudacuta]|uniref:NADH dehydrogenase [ubiquinone] 1 alpha subcomplex subunit 3 n=1 Tax=Ammospiza caudacuta TaxID=2857398 RepID=UPI002738F30A|nr:NADH dehydrogenase [ubiquinone] 1 alpha subcomplex subunit 3 [Ammospiza caudacuta]
MAGRMASALRSLWAKEPVVAVSCGIAALALLSPLLSPYSKYSGMINQATPYTYPVPLRDDGCLPDVPSHPCCHQGRDLKWLKNL